MLRSLATRYLVDPIQADLADKMVFVSGPRQVGKPTLLLRSGDDGCRPLPLERCREAVNILRAMGTSTHVAQVTKATTSSALRPTPYGI